MRISWIWSFLSPDFGDVDKRESGRRPCQCSPTLGSAIRILPNLIQTLADCRSYSKFLCHLYKGLSSSLSWILKAPQSHGNVPRKFQQLHRFRDQHERRSSTSIENSYNGKDPNRPTISRLLRVTEIPNPSPKRYRCRTTTWCERPSCMAELPGHPVDNEDCRCSRSLPNGLGGDALISIMTAIPILRPVTTPTAARLIIHSCRVVDGNNAFTDPLILLTSPGDRSTMISNSRSLLMPAEI